MKYRIEVEIDRPRDAVISLLDDPDKMVHWQPELSSFDLLEGPPPGEPGAKMRLNYRIGKRDIAMIETVKRRRLPEELVATYDTDGGTSTVVNMFHALDHERTLWVSETDMKCHKFMMKIMARLMPGAFRKQTQKMMLQFKHYAETHIPK